MDAAYACVKFGLLAAGRLGEVIEQHAQHFAQRLTGVTLLQDGEALEQISSPWATASSRNCDHNRSCRSATFASWFRRMTVTTTVEMNGRV